MPLNISSLKEFIILIAGPFFQVIASLILIKILPEDKELINIYHYGILIFNLLPVYPLDGGKIINLFFNVFLPYKLSLRLCIYLSYFVVSMILILQKSITLNIIIMLFTMLILTTKEKRRINLLYNKFILERYLNNYKFHKSKLINSSDNFYRNYRHIIKENGKYYLESDYLNKKMQKSMKNRWLLKKCYAIINLSLEKETNHMGH